MKKTSLNFFTIGVLRKVLKRATELRAGLVNKAFYCNALNGGSDYDISINSDMSVSCNCQDFDGSARIGDLSCQTLADIFNSPLVKTMRHKLASGRLPFLLCTTCRALCMVKKDAASYYARHYNLPRRGIMIENTSNCNLNCLACGRMQLSKIRKKRSLSLEDIKKISSMLREHNIESVNFFKLGEPFLSPSIYEELKIIKDDNPRIKICVSTNGLLIDNDKSRQAALLLDHIIFSIDGNNDEVLRKYQRNGSFHKVYNNMKDLVACRDSRGLRLPVIEWQYLLFNWNDKKGMVLEAIELARQSGIDMISFWPTRNPVYGIPWRYYFSGFYKTIGYQSWRGKEQWKGRRLQLR